jgi:hypothetical protein
VDLYHLYLIVNWGLCHYYPLWFEIRANSSYISGPSHVLKEIQIIRSLKSKDLKSKQVREIAVKFTEKGAWQGHSEIVLTALLTSKDKEDRRFAIKKILEIRKGQLLGDTSVRYFFVPTLNWQAADLKNLISWKDAYEPVLTCPMPEVELWQLLDLACSTRRSRSTGQSPRPLIELAKIYFHKKFQLKQTNGFRVMAFQSLAENNHTWHLVLP